MNTSAARESITDAMKFWEPLRLIYNAVLALIVILYFIADYPRSRSVLNIDILLVLFLLAVLANIAYCTAYIVDLFVQASGFRAEWRRFRWILFLIGMTFAGILTRFFALGFFPPAAL